MEKTCSKCGSAKPLTEFKKDQRARDGYGNCCKECKRKLDKEYRSRPDISQKRSEYRKEHRATGRHRYGDRYKGRYDSRAYRATILAWHKRNPLAKAAHKKVEDAIRRGVLPKASACCCAKCPNQAHDYHHPNGYEQGHELDVIALCCSCHQLAHSELVENQ